MGYIRPSGHVSVEAAVISATGVDVVLTRSLVECLALPRCGAAKWGNQLHYKKRSVQQIQLNTLATFLQRQKTISFSPNTLRAV